MEISLEITTDDLDVIKQLIEISTKNGLISPKSLVTIGTLYEKIDSLLSNINSLDIE